MDSDDRPFLNIIPYFILPDALLILAITFQWPRFLCCAAFVAYLVYMWTATWYTTGDRYCDYTTGGTLGAKVLVAFVLLVLAEPSKNFSHRRDTGDPNIYPLWRRLLWATCVVHAQRGIGWNFEVGLHRLPVGFKPDLYQDLKRTKSTSEYNEDGLHQDPPPTFGMVPAATRHNARFHDGVPSISTTAISGWCYKTTIERIATSCFSCVCVASITLCYHEPAVQHPCHHMRGTRNIGSSRLAGLVWQLVRSVYSTKLLGQCLAPATEEGECTDTRLVP
jgi:hypothetical protein